MVINHPQKRMPRHPEIRRHLAKMYKAPTKAVMIFGFKTAFGGNVTKCFALIYDSVARARHFEPKYRLVKVM